MKAAEIDELAKIVGIGAARARCQRGRSRAERGSLAKRVLSVAAHQAAPSAGQFLDLEESARISLRQQGSCLTRLIRFGQLDLIGIACA